MPKLVTVRLRPSGGIKEWLRGRKLADSQAASWLLGYLVYRVCERLCEELNVEEVLRPNLPRDHPFEKKPGDLKPWEARGCVMPDAVELVVDGDVDVEEVARTVREVVERVLEDLLGRGRESPWERRDDLYEPLKGWWERVLETDGVSPPEIELPTGLIQTSVAVVDLEDPEDGEAYREAVRRVASLLATRTEVMDAKGSEGQPCSVCGKYPIVGRDNLWEELSERLPPQLLKEWSAGVERLCPACLLKRYFGMRVLRFWYPVGSGEGGGVDGVSWIPSTAEVAITPVKIEMLRRREDLGDDFREAAREFLRRVLPEQLRQLARYLRCVGESDRAEKLEEAAEGLEDGRLAPEDLPDEVARELLRRTPKAPRLDEELGEELRDADDTLLKALLCVEGKFWYDPKAPRELRELLRAADLEDYYTPHFALLKLDGDRMGELFSRDPSTTKRASRATIEFGLEAMRIVHEHYGTLLYCGGDDVFAALPLHVALDCAFELEEAFRRHLSRWGKTCSAGLAVIHHIHPLRDAVDLAYRLEKRAKKAGRNRLAVGLYRRNAPERVAVLRWEVGGERPWRLLAELADLVSRRAAYHLPRDWWEGWWRELDGSEGHDPEELLRSLLGYVTLRHREEGADEGRIAGLVERIAETAGEAAPKDGDPGREVGRALEVVLELRAECPIGGGEG
ncbi:MAG: type III-B CRISPR-associated protein Cas10/Cmr2 [Euryarchaeota archaeon]